MEDESLDSVLECWSVFSSVKRQKAERDLWGERKRFIQNIKAKEQSKSIAKLQVI